MIKTSAKSFLGLVIPQSVSALQLGESVSVFPSFTCKNDSSQAILKHLARFKSIPINGDDQMKHQNRICLLVTCRRGKSIRRQV
ncbi:hypothetical protein RclHR1_05980004 [Rhizophagus clarus]|uniref:Uncharacterized protein n=1 Tax=Rhizophagus clarus TaxID=94130 RepID=A0A2Z6RPZ4_9GLOM|nr:hypothetical protein RclHR1_05980004 [Rhizophagus clarus]